MRRQAKFPDWWLKADIPSRLRERLTAQFTIHRDGYMRWYAGAPRFVCGKTVPADAVEAFWHKKKDAIDRADALILPDGVQTYRTVLSEFLDIQKARVGAAKNRIEQRTYANYVDTLNDFGAFVVNGRKIADLNIRDIGPGEFTAYAAKFAAWKSAGFDTVVTRVNALFRWAVQMEYIDRYRPGPQFQRPSKQDIQDDRIARVRSFTAAEVARLLDVASPSMRCMIGLGVGCALNNSEVSNLTPKLIDFERGIIDFRRRKVGRVRRVCPIPGEVLSDLRSYNRPEPAEPRFAGYFFLTPRGVPYHIVGCTLSALMRKVMIDAGIKVSEGRNFAGLRTTWFNLAPRDGYALERMLIAGHQHGVRREIPEIEFDHYVEHFDLSRLRHVSDSVWAKINSARQGSAAAPPSASGNVDAGESSQRDG